MMQAQATLLVALVSSRIERTRYRRPISRHNKLVKASGELITRWWKDLDKLESVGRYCAQLEKQVLSGECAQATEAISVLQTHLRRKLGVRRARVAVARAVRVLKNIAVHERTTTLNSRPVSERQVQKFAELAAQHAFGPASWPNRMGTSVELASVTTPSHSIRLETYKKDFTDGQLSPSTSEVAERIGEHMRDLAVGGAFRDFVLRSGLAPVNAASLRHNYDATTVEAQSFITAVTAECARLRTAGQQPVVLVGRTAPGAYLHAHRWGSNPWQHELPPGVVWRRGDVAKGEPDRELLNDVPVHELNTPNGDCYVVPFSSIEVLQLGGTSLASAVAIRWGQLNDERLELVLSWKAHFRESA